jgi:hypothetical protein
MWSIDVECFIACVEYGLIVNVLHFTDDELRLRHFTAHLQLILFELQEESFIKHESHFVFWVDLGVSRLFGHLRCFIEIIVAMDESHSFNRRETVGSVDVS